MEVHYWSRDKKKKKKRGQEQTEELAWNFIPYFKINTLFILLPPFSQEVLQTTDEDQQNGRPIKPTQFWLPHYLVLQN